MTSHHDFDFRAPRPLRIASCMAPNADDMCRKLAAYLAARLGLAVVLVEDVPWLERERMFDAGEIDLCWICGLPYALKADRAQAIEPCVAPVMQGERYRAQPIYFSDIVVRADSAYASFADLAGERWAYNEPRSHSGFNLVCYHLAAHGLTLDYFGDLVEAGAHQAALELILTGKVAAGAIDTTVLEAEIRRRPALARSVRAVGTLGPSPAPPWVFSATVPQDLRLKIRGCLGDMHRDDAGVGVLASWGIAELRQVTDEVYDPIREMARSAAAASPHRRTRPPP